MKLDDFHGALLDPRGLPDERHVQPEDVCPKFQLLPQERYAARCSAGFETRLIEDAGTGQVFDVAGAPDRLTYERIIRDRLVPRMAKLGGAPCSFCVHNTFERGIFPDPMKPGRVCKFRTKCAAGVAAFDWRAIWSKLGMEHE